MRNNILRVLKNKWALAAIVASVVFSSAFAFAASLGLTSSTLSAGNASVASCASAVTAAYTTTFDSTTGLYRVNNINFGGINSACGGKTLAATLTSGGTAVGSEVTYSVTGSETGGNATVAVGGHISAKDVDGISVAIS